MQIPPCDMLLSKASSRQSPRLLRQRRVVTTATFYLQFERRLTGSGDRRGTARLILGVGLAPGSRPCADLLARINGAEGFYATDISDMDLAQVGACAVCWLRLTPQPRTLELWQGVIRQPRSRQLASCTP